MAGQQILTTSENTDEPVAGLLGGASNGDEPAIRRLVDHFLPRLTRAARRMNARDPESVANGVLFRVLRTLDRIERLESATFQAVLYRALKNEIIDEHRASAIRPVTLPLNAALNNGPDDLAFADDGAFTAVEDREYVEGLLESLKAEQRDVLRYRFLQDLSVEETANLLGRSSNATRQLQHRALSALRAAMAAAVGVAVLVLSLTGGSSIETIAPAAEPAGEESEGRPAAGPDDVGEQGGAILPPAPSSDRGMAVPTGPVWIRHAETGRYLVASSPSEVSFAAVIDAGAEWIVSGAGGSYLIESHRYEGLRLGDNVVAIQHYSGEVGSADLLSPLGGFVIRSTSSGRYLAAGSGEPVMMRDGGRSARWTIEAASIGEGDEEHGLADPLSDADPADGVCEVGRDGRCSVEPMPDDGGTNPTTLVEPDSDNSPADSTDTDSTDTDSTEAGEIETGSIEVGDREVTLPAPPVTEPPPDFAAPQPPVSEPSDMGTLPRQLLTPSSDSFSLRLGHAGLCVEVAPTPDMSPTAIGGTDGVDGTDGADGTGGTDGASGGTVGDAAVVQAPCTGADNQLFTAGDVGDGQFELVASHSGHCLQVADASFEPGAQIVERPCGEVAARWFLSDSETTASDGATVIGGINVMSVLSGYCLALPGSNPVDYGVVVQMPCDDRPSQLFHQ